MQLPTVPYLTFPCVGLASTTVSSGRLDPRRPRGTSTGNLQNARRCFAALHEPHVSPSPKVREPHTQVRIGVPASGIRWHLYWRRESLCWHDESC